MLYEVITGQPETGIAGGLHREFPYPLQPGVGETFIGVVVAVGIDTRLTGERAKVDAVTLDGAGQQHGDTGEGVVFVSAAGHRVITSYSIHYTKLYE